MRGELGVVLGLKLLGHGLRLVGNGDSKEGSEQRRARSSNSRAEARATRGIIPTCQFHVTLDQWRSLAGPIRPDRGLT